MTDKMRNAACAGTSTYLLTVEQTDKIMYRVNTKQRIRSYFLTL